MAGPGASISAAAGGVRFLGVPGSYWRLLSRGAVLLMITLGIYRFWLATDVRRFLWSNTEIAGETLEYTGTPLELLLGFLVAIAILIPVYAGFFLAALDLGTYGRLSGLFAFAGLGVLGQYAVFRARRYRLTRTIYRGLRFHQEGSAWAFALRAVAWWSATALTLGLAYPFHLASLERYKMSNTYYGDLAGQFAGSGFKLMLRGLPMWLMVIGPLVLAVGAFVDVVDWQALGNALAQGGDDVMARIEGGNPGLGAVIVFALLMGGTAGAWPPCSIRRSRPSCCAGGRRACASAPSRCAPSCAYATSTAPMSASCGTRCCSASWRHWPAVRCSRRWGC